MCLTKDIISIKQGNLLQPGFRPGVLEAQSTVVVERPGKVIVWALNAQE
jgi:hypothetical protein